MVSGNRQSAAILAVEVIREGKIIKITERKKVERYAMQYYQKYSYSHMVIKRLNQIIHKKPVI